MTDRSTSALRPVVVVFLLLLSCQTAKHVDEAEQRDHMLARAKGLELNTPYEAPPGNALEHHASGFAKIMCSAVFITGLKPDFAAENVGYFTAPYEERAKLGKPVIDTVRKTVSVSVPNGSTRTAVYTVGQGCITLPIGSDKLFFQPQPVPPLTPEDPELEWPMGNKVPDDPFPKEVMK